MDGVGPRLERVCPNCGGRDMVEVHSEGDVVCKGCGLVVEAHIIDERSEWRTFGDKDKEGDDPSRVGGASNPLLDDGGLGTMIGRVQGDGGASFALNKMHMRQNNQMRALRSAFGAIGEMCVKLNQSDAVKSAASEIYKNVHDNKVLRGRKSELIYAACVLVASRQFKELGALFRSNMPPGTSMTAICKQLYACYKGINELQQSQALESAAARAAGGGGGGGGAGGSGGGGGGGAGPTGPAAGRGGGGAGGVAGAAANAESVMPRCLSALGYGNKEIIAAKRIAQAVLKLGSEQTMPWSGKNPMTVAGSIIWGVVQLEQLKAAAGGGASGSGGGAGGEADERAINEVSGATGMAPITIREGFRDMLPVWFQDGTIVPETFATKQQLEALGAKLGVDVNAAVDAGGSKAARKRKKQKTG
ncbi:transcription initiation factor IIB [Raphidocelis subcapitata]|uniref:General transcription factor TFIIB n=1 Tax=Raphidocelis subcapitata TaxID=307507 RepID=A0A2V0NQY4_9CHLO|nr:transcription initiation factor IIB [Raphidocelis subcapitata]|eukprot:GBF87963.1 transcription initiation factor IIB [Raphidocelis subcapitata]